MKFLVLVLALALVFASDSTRWAKDCGASLEQGSGLWKPGATIEQQLGESDAAAAQRGACALAGIATQLLTRTIRRALVVHLQLAKKNSVCLHQAAIL